MNLKSRPGTYLITVGLSLVAIAFVFQILVSIAGGYPVIITTLGPLGLLLATIGFCRRVLFTLDHLSPVPGYQPAPALERIEAR